MSNKREAIKGLLDKKPTVNTNIQSTVNTVLQKTGNTALQDTEKLDLQRKKKVTYEFDFELYKKLKVYAANSDKHMVEVVEAAVRKYLSETN
ncbi:hypothetical protein ACFQ3W_25875 [Paenibacillus puldeungensis]|uniref:Uncharacterized protein n=1 Tax=Paenibacillus puldeungensis TaxID=696536 RepID=A0ABW3S545_9BACL